MATQPIPRAQVRNAADPRQVKRAERVERERLEKFLENLRRVMLTTEGRAVMWELLERAGIYRSVFDPHGSLQSYKAGRQDFGHELIAVIHQAGDQGDGEHLFELMEREARLRKRLEDRATDAAHTPSVTTGGNGRARTLDDEDEGGQIDGRTS
jgi:hypothetical protein